MDINDHKRIRLLLQSLLAHGSEVSNVSKALVCLLPALRHCNGWVPVSVVARMVVVTPEWLLAFIADKNFFADGHGHWEYALSMGEKWTSATAGQGWLSRATPADCAHYFSAVTKLFKAYPEGHWVHMVPDLLPTKVYPEWTDGAAPTPHEPSPPRHVARAQWT